MNNVDIGQKYKRIVQYFWDPEPRNDCMSGEPIWCLGKEYRPCPESEHEGDGTTPEPQAYNISTSSHSKAAPEPQTPSSWAESIIHLPEQEPSSNSDWPPSFLDDFESKVWMTYRSNFPLIPKSSDPNAPSSMSIGVRLRSQLLDTQGFTTDTGWGCMIRSGQSLLANALSTLYLGRDWRRGTRIEEESRLLSLFADDPRAPFSIHRFVEHGASSCGKYPGEWFGPSAAARCIEALSSECKDAGLNVYVTSDGSDVYEERFRQIAGDNGDGLRPTLILLGVRLGIDKVTPVYWEALKDAIRCPQSVGIAGGRPSSSHYFIGIQGSHFFYLDPHHTRPALPYNSSSFTPSEFDSYHTRRLRRLHISDMDPSMLIGFLIKDEADWQDWKARVRSLASPAPVPGRGKKQKGFIHIFDHGETASEIGRSMEREGAVDEVEVLDDDEEHDHDDGERSFEILEKSERRDDRSDQKGVKE